MGAAWEVGLGWGWDSGWAMGEADWGGFLAKGMQKAKQST